MPIKQRKRKVPNLSFTLNRGIGWHVSYRDKATGMPTKHRFGITERARESDARILYHAWVAQHLGGQPQPVPFEVELSPRSKGRASQETKPLSGSLIEIASGLIEMDRVRTRSDDDERRQGSICEKIQQHRRVILREFLRFLNDRHGAGAAGRMRLADLSMEDVETYNRLLIEQRRSQSTVSKRMQTVKALIDRAGRPEHGGQVLGWNWDSRDVHHGKPARLRRLPTVPQLEKLLKATDLRGQTMIWLGIGLGFGSRDLAGLRVGQIDARGYDLRRSKTGIERYGETPPYVWSLVKTYQRDQKLKEGELMFRTVRGEPLINGITDAVAHWWTAMRLKIGETSDSLDGFYVLRHLGATEYGSRPGASIGAVKRWLGHAASSAVADVYMKPVAPEHRKVVVWVSERLTSAR